MRAFERRLDRLENEGEQGADLSDAAALLAAVNANVAAVNVLRRQLCGDAQAADPPPPADVAWLARLTPLQRRRLVESIGDNKRAADCLSQCGGL